MIEPEIPANEPWRQAAVERYNILDTEPEDRFDNITKLMAQLTGAPISLITLLDHERNYLKSHHGVPFSESPRNISFCGHAINAVEPITIVEDATKDSRFSDNPLVANEGVRFYAGAPLETPDGYRLGTLCLFDIQPRILSEHEKETLLNMARQVEALLDLRYQNQILKSSQQLMKEKYEELESFAAVVTHDIKSPVVNLSYTIREFEERYGEQLNISGMKIIHRMQDTTGAIGNYIDELLNYYTSDSLLGAEVESVKLGDIYKEVESIAAGSAQLIADNNDKIVSVKRAALLQILVNLVTNGVKYNNHSSPTITIRFSEDEKHYIFTVSDNGIGIPADKLTTIFEMFSTSDSDQQNEGTGIGLAIVKKLTGQLGGEITVTSTIEAGSEFVFTVSRHPSPTTLYR